MNLRTKRARAGLAILSLLLVSIPGETKAQRRAPRPEALKRVKAATAFVMNNSFGTGTAFCIRKDGLFITNQHVLGSVAVGGSVTLILHPNSKEQRSAQARVIRVSEESDLALLKISDAKGLTTVDVANEAGLTETMPVIAFGFPFGQVLSEFSGSEYPDVSVNTGKISSLRRKDGKLSTIQIDAVVNPGNSGGPLVDGDGKVIGVIVAGIPGALVNFAIPVGTVKRFLEQPSLIVDVPSIDFAHRTETARFGIEVIDVAGRFRASNVELSFLDSDGKRRSFKAKSDGDRFVVEAAPSKREGTVRLRLIAHVDHRPVSVDGSNMEYRIGSKSLTLLGTRSIEKRADGHIVTTTSGKKYAGPIEGLDGILYGADPKTEFASIDRIDIYALADRPLDVEYEIVAKGRNARNVSANGNIEFEAPPARVPNNIYDPQDPFAPQISELVLEVKIAGKSRLYLRPDGLQWTHESLQVPGVKNARGTYMLVNGKKWDMNWSRNEGGGTVSDVYPLKLGQIHFAFERMHVSIERNGVNLPDRGKVRGLLRWGPFHVFFDDREDGAAWYKVRLRRRPPFGASPGGVEKPDAVVAKVEGGPANGATEPTNGAAESVNLARTAEVVVSEQWPGNGAAGKAIDGRYAVGNGEYWFPGSRPPKPDSLTIRFREPRPVTSIRMLLPIGTKRFGHGHEPLDYTITLIEDRKRTVVADVKNGQHPKTQASRKRKTRFVIVDLPKPMIADQVEFSCSRTSGKNYAPIVFEFEVHGPAGGK